jgi:hypothetical protein
MSEMRLTECRGCGAKIGFLKNPRTGKWMPVNPERVTGVDAPDDGVLIAENGAVLRGVLPEDVGYVPHWSTCPVAGDFRRGRPSRSD